MVKKSEGENLTHTLDKLSKIVEWFESQQEIDVEMGLEKVREAAGLIKTSKSRLADINNEFKEIEKEIREEIAEPAVRTRKSSVAASAMPAEAGETEGIPF